MPKYYVGCEGSQEDFYEFLLDLAEKVDWALHPWEQPMVQRAMKDGEIQKPKTEPKAGPISQDNILPDTPVSTPKAEIAPAKAQEAKAEGFISAEELQNLCADLGERFGKAAFKELKEKAGFSSMKALDGKGRTDFAAMITAYIKEHENA